MSIKSEDPFYRAVSINEITIVEESTKPTLAGEEGGSLPEWRVVVKVSGWANKENAYIGDEPDGTHAVLDIGDSWVTA